MILLLPVSSTFFPGHSARRTRSLRFVRGQLKLKFDMRLRRLPKSLYSKVVAVHICLEVSMLIGLFFSHYGNCKRRKYPSEQSLVIHSQRIGLSWRSSIHFPLEQPSRRAYIQYSRRYGPDIVRYHFHISIALIRNNMDPSNPRTSRGIYIVTISFVKARHILS